MHNINITIVRTYTRRPSLYLLLCTVCLCLCAQSVTAATVTESSVAQCHRLCRTVIVLMLCIIPVTATLSNADINWCVCVMKI